MTQQISQDALLSKVNSLKLQLGSTLDKAIKVSELDQREKYVDSITSLKRQLQQLKLKLQKQSSSFIQLSLKVFNKLALKHNTLVGELNMKQNKCLWNSGKENKRKNRVGEYEDLLQEVVERDEVIKGLKEEVSGLKGKNKELREEYGELEESLKVIMEKHHRSVQEHIEEDKEEMRRRTEQLEREVEQNRRVIAQFQQVEKQNLLICAKGAEQIHKLSKQLSRAQTSFQQSHQIIQQKQEQINQLLLKLQAKNISTIDNQHILNDYKTKIRDQQFRLKVNQQQLQTLKQIQGKRNDQVKNVQQHYQGRIQQIKTLYQRRVQQLQQQLTQRQTDIKIKSNSYQQRLEESLNTITHLNMNVITLKESIEEIEVVKRELNLKHELVHSKNMFEINRLSQLCEFQEETNRELISQKERLEMESSWKHLESEEASEGKYFYTQQSEIRERGREERKVEKESKTREEQSQQQSQQLQSQQSEQIDNLSRRLIQSHIQQQKYSEQKRQLQRKYIQTIKSNESLQQSLRKLQLEKKTFELTILQLTHSLQSKSNQLKRFEEKIQKEQGGGRAIRNRVIELETELEFKNNKVAELKEELVRCEGKLKETEGSYNEMVKQKSVLETKGEQWKRAMKEMEGDRRREREENGKLGTLVKELREKIECLEKERSMQISKMNAEIEEDKRQFENSLNVSNVSKSRSIKMKVLEDIRKMMHIME